MTRELFNAIPKGQVSRFTFYTVPSCLVEEGGEWIWGQTEDSQPSPIFFFFLMNWNLLSRHSKFFNHVSKTFCSKCNLLFHFPLSIAMWGIFEALIFYIFFYFLNPPLPQLCLVSSSFNSQDKCYLPFAALFTHPSGCWLPGICHLHVIDQDLPCAPLIPLGIRGTTRTFMKSLATG